jgi:hypothetical protein
VEGRGDGSGMDAIEGGTAADDDDEEEEEDEEGAEGLGMEFGGGSEREMCVGQRAGVKRRRGEESEEEAGEMDAIFDRHGGPHGLRSAGGAAGAAGAAVGGGNGEEEDGGRAGMGGRGVPEAMEADEGGVIAETGRLFVRNLPYSAAEEDLRAVFEAHGELQDLHLVVDRWEGGGGAVRVRVCWLDDVKPRRLPHHTQTWGQQLHPPQFHSSLTPHPPHLHCPFTRKE